MEVVDDADAATFASTPNAPTHFSQSSGAGDQVSSFGIVSQEANKLLLLFLSPNRFALGGEGLDLDNTKRCERQVLVYATDVVNTAPCADVLSRHGAATVKERAPLAAARGNAVRTEPITKQYDSS